MLPANVLVAPVSRLTRRIRWFCRSCDAPWEGHAERGGARQRGAAAGTTSQGEACGWQAIAGWRRGRGAGQARTVTSAKLPSGAMETPLGYLNWALVPTPSEEPGVLPPATVVVTPVITSGGDGDGGDGGGGSGEGDGGGGEGDGGGGLGDGGGGLGEGGGGLGEGGAGGGEGDGRVEPPS